MTPGPNDFHFDTDAATGQRIMKSGLGPDEPSEKLRTQMEQDAAAARARKEELADMERRLRGQAADFEERERAMRDKEAELEERAQQAEIDKVEIEERLNQLAQRQGATTEDSGDAGPAPVAP